MNKKLNTLVSICIPTFNSGAYVYRAIESCIYQTYKNIEIIIVDNASTDNTQEVVLLYMSRDKRVRFFKNETNIGSGNNFLKCAEYASGFFLQALCADDWLSRDYIEECINIFSQHSQVAVVIPSVFTFKLEDINQFKFLNVSSSKSGIYLVDWYFRSAYHHSNLAGRGFHSLARRDDFIKALRSVLRNRINLLNRGGILEPLDSMISWRVIVNYKYLFVSEKATYIKTLHGKDHVGLQGDYFESRAGQVRYATAVRRSYEAFYLSHGLIKHFHRLRLFGGLSIFSNAALFILVKTFKKKKDGADYVIAVKDYFRDFSKKEKWLIIINVMPYIILRIIHRIFDHFSRKSSFFPDKSLFLNHAYMFETNSIIHHV